MKHLSNYEDVLRRHALPEVLFPPDISLALNIPEHEADERARGGCFGPRFFVAGRVAVLRQDFLDHLVEIGEASGETPAELLAPRLRVIRPENRDDR